MGCTADISYKSELLKAISACADCDRGAQTKRARDLSSATAAAGAMSFYMQISPLGFAA